MLVISLLSGRVDAQTTADWDERLFASFEANHIEKLASTNPQILHYWTYYLDHGYQWFDNPVEKQLKLDTVQIADPNDFNLLALPIQRQADSPVYYYAVPINKMLMVYGERDLAKRFQAFKQAKRGGLND